MEYCAVKRVPDQRNIRFEQIRAFWRTKDPRHLHFLKQGQQRMTGLQDGRTAGLDVQYKPTKKQFTNEPEGIRPFQGHQWKALGEKNLNLL